MDSSCVLCGEARGENLAWVTVDDECDGGTFRAVLQDASGRKELNGLDGRSVLCPGCADRLVFYKKTVLQLDSLK